MDKQKFYEAVTSYKASMKQAQTMLERGLISADDYAKIDTKLAQKYETEKCSFPKLSPSFILSGSVQDAGILL